MGEAKRRGSYLERSASAKSKLDALRPKALTCSECSSEITEIHDGSTRHLKGIEAYFVGYCPECAKLNYKIFGDPPQLVAALEKALLQSELEEIEEYDSDGLAI